MLARGKRRRSAIDKNLDPALSCPLHSRIWFAAPSSPNGAGIGACHKGGVRKGQSQLRRRARPFMAAVGMVTGWRRSDGICRRRCRGRARRSRHWPPHRRGRPGGRERWASAPSSVVLSVSSQRVSGRSSGMKPEAERQIVAHLVDACNAASATRHRAPGDIAAAEPRNCGWGR